MAYDITLKYSPDFLRGIPQDDLEVLLNQAQQRYFELRHQCSPHGRVKFVPRPDLFGKVKKDIARMKTLLAEKQRAKV